MKDDNQSKKRQTIIQAVKFTLFSISAGLIEAGVFALLNNVILKNVTNIDTYWLAYLPAVVASVVWNFTFNRKFTFHSANNIPLAMAKVTLFYVIFIPLTTWGGNELEKIGVNEYIVLGATMVLNFVLEFIYQKFWVFNAKFDIKKKDNSQQSVDVKNDIK